MVPSWSGAEAFSPTWPLEVGLSLRLGLFAGPGGKLFPKDQFPSFCDIPLSVSPSGPALESLKSMVDLGDLSVHVPFLVV